VTHEYVIAIGGRIAGAHGVDGRVATAIAWAADRVLAVGSDDAVRAISRGDSTFLDLGGCAVTAADPGERLEPGAPADLQFWRDEPRSGRPVATVRGGAFREGDEHAGPFVRLPRTLDPGQAHG
jgi:hypothetical protein